MRERTHNDDALSAASEPRAERSKLGQLSAKTSSWVRSNGRAAPGARSCLLVSYWTLAAKKQSKKKGSVDHVSV